MNSSIKPDNHPDQNTVHTPLIHSSGQPHPDARALTPENFVEPARALAPKDFVEPTRALASKDHVEPARTPAPEDYVEPARSLAPKDFVEPARTLAPEDYVEPACVLCGDPYGKAPEVKPIPQQRIIAKMDDYMSRRDYAGAERHLLYWLEEARLGHDERGQLMLHNELVGHYRKTGERDKSFASGEEALRLLDSLDMTATVSAGTTYVNYATACNAFGENERALALFEKARAIYESSASKTNNITEDPQHSDSGTASKTDTIAEGPQHSASGTPSKTNNITEGPQHNSSGAAAAPAPARPDLLGGLYNNMALTCVAVGRFDEAFDLYDKALQTMAQVPGGELEQAITYLNMADAVESKYGPGRQEERICELLDKAYDLFDQTTAPHDGYYAFVCEKCAPAFSYYGYFLAAEDLEERAAQIYERKDP